VVLVVTGTRPQPSAGDNSVVTVEPDVRDVLGALGLWS
jgi:hypothetical protein